MTRAARAAFALAPALALGACAGTAEPAQPDVIAAWSEPAGIAPELVYVTEVDGFELATQSVGVFGDDGLSAAYVGQEADAPGTLLLTTSRTRGAAAEVPCDDADEAAAADGALRCAVARGDVQVVLEGDGVEPATVRAAAQAVRVPSADELGTLFADVQVAGPPVERGDLPPVGDGAPRNEPGVGG